MGYLPLVGALLVLMDDSAVELALISSMVGYLHRSGANRYPFKYSGGPASVPAKPAGLMLNQGHTSNGAAGTALVGICFGGFLMMLLERRRAKKNSYAKPSVLFLAYTIFSILAFLLTLAALAYVFSVTNSTKHNRIVQSIAFATPTSPYPQDSWTPETWTKAMLALPLSNPVDIKYLNHWLKVMDGWKWNLIPMFLIQGAVTALIVLTYRKESRGARASGSREEMTKAEVI